MNKHTPGPWETANALSGKMFVTIEHNIGMARRQVCEVMPDIATGDYKANACLIAAAPELLEIVESLAILQHELASAISHGNKSFETCDASMCVKARAVIAKAKGEQS